MTENPTVRTDESLSAPPPPLASLPTAPIVPTPVVPAKRLVACGWCDSTHIADVTCTCKEPCAQGWCPAAVELETSPFHFQRDAVA